MPKTTVHENPWFTVSVHSDGTREQYQIDAADSALTIGRTADDKLVFVQGTRYPTGLAAALELPGGMIGLHETALEAATRELAEETGYRASSMVHVGDFFQVPAISPARCHVFEATVEPNGVAQLEEGELWRTVLIEVAQLRSLIASGSIQDGITLAALGRYLAIRS